LDEVDDGPSPRCRGHGGGGLHRARARQRRRPAHHQPRRAGSRVRPPLRAARGAARRAARRAVQLLRLRRHQRLAALPARGVAMIGAALDRRLHFVVGKGGVGKTTVAAALARLLTRRGRRTLAVEVDDARRLSTLLGASGTTGTPTVIAPGLSVVAIEGRAALEEYLGLI